MPTLCILVCILKSRVYDCFTFHGMVPWVVRFLNSKCECELDWWKLIKINKIVIKSVIKINEIAIFVVSKLWSQFDQIDNKWSNLWSQFDQIDQMIQILFKIVITIWSNWNIRYIFWKLFCLRYRYRIFCYHLLMVC